MSSLVSFFWRGRFRHFFADREHIVRLLFALFFWLLLALFLHFREVRVDFVELGAPSSRYVVAQVDFEFIDDELKALLKQEATRDLGDIYRFDEASLKKTRSLFEADLVRNPAWRSHLEGTTFAQLYEASDFLEREMVVARFCDQRTRRVLQETGYPGAEHTFEGQIRHGEMTPDPLFFKELTLELQEKFGLPEPSAIFVITFYRQRSGPLKVDGSEKIAISEYFESHLPAPSSSVAAGTRLVTPGDLVTERHIAQLQAMKRAMRDRQGLAHPENLLGAALGSLLLVIAGALYLRSFETRIYESVKRLGLFLSILALTLILAKVCDVLLAESGDFYLSHVRYPILVPFAALMTFLLLGSGPAQLATFVTTVLLGMTLAVESSRFLLLNMVTGLLALHFAKAIKRRKEIFGVAIKIFLFSVPIFISFALSDRMLLSYTLAIDLAGAAIFLFLIAMLVVTLLPLFEALFAVMTDMALMEWLDPSIPLLRRLALEAPGTYQHSLGVSHLAEAAASAIGASALFCRVAALYHDIGKVSSPSYFAENIPSDAFDIHKLLKPTESANVIINHVIEGEALARQSKLPSDFIDVIREHHGTTLVHYFYCQELSRAGGDREAVDESLFRYPGPKPHSKESAILMIADTLEASSRSLEQINYESVSERVERLVRDKMEEGQLDECELTFEELGKVKEAMIKTLLSMVHHRPKYPAKPKPQTV